MRRSFDAYVDDNEGKHNRRERGRSDNVQHRFDVLFEKYYRPLVSYAARMTGSYEVAEDLATDAFVVLYDRPERWEPDETARRLLYRVTHNAAIDLLRAQNVHERMLETVTQGMSIPGVMAGLPNASQHVEHEELLNALDVAIQALPPRRRAVVTLRREQGLRNAEIAEILDVTVKAVELHLSLAMRDLRAALAPFAE